MWYLILAYICISRSFVVGWIVREDQEHSFNRNFRTFYRFIFALVVLELIFATYFIKKITGRIK